MITVRVNEVSIEIEETTNIHQLLNKVNSSTQGVALAINNTIVGKDGWDTQLFQANDNILIIKATQGG